MLKIIFGKLKTKKKSEDYKELYILDENYQKLVLDYNHLSSIVKNYDPIDKQEWLASNFVGLFKQVEKICFVLMECCSCSQLYSGSTVINAYSWIDDKSRKNKVSAKEFMKNFLYSTEKILSSEEIMPTKHGKSFPSNFIIHIQKISKSMFGIIEHAYNSHFNDILKFDFVNCLNTALIHFVILSDEFNLMEPKDLEPLETLITKYKKEGENEST